MYNIEFHNVDSCLRGSLVLRGRNKSKLRSKLALPIELMEARLVQVSTSLLMQVIITRVHERQRLQKTRQLEIHGLIFAMCFLTLMQGLARKIAHLQYIISSLIEVIFLISTYSTCVYKVSNLILSILRSQMNFYTGHLKIDKINT